MKGKFRLLIPVAMLAGILIASLPGCKDDAGTGPTTPTTLLKAVTNLRAFSASISSIGLTWTATADAGVSEFESYQVTVKIGTTTLSTLTVSKTATSTTVTGLVEGTVYTFDVIAKASASAQTYLNSTSQSVQWAPARRLNTEGTLPIDIFEIRSAAGGSGLQFYNAATVGPRVLSIGTTAGFQQVIDAFLDTTSAGTIVMKSAHLNPFLVGQAKRTKFSTIDSAADSLNIGQSSPPATGTYTLDVVTIGSQAVSTGKIFYAVSNDTNYVRILVNRDPTSQTLLYGSSPNRRVRVQLSYQGTRNVPFSKQSP